MYKRRRLMFLIPFGIAAILLLFSYVVMLLWNGVLLPVLHVQVITFWQAAGIFILSRILFGGFRRGGFNGRGKPGFGRGAWREKWMNMNDEEKAKFREGWQKKCRRPGERE